MVMAKKKKTQRCSRAREGSSGGCKRPHLGEHLHQGNGWGAWLRLGWKTRVRVQRKRKPRAPVGLERDCQKEEGLPRDLGWEMAQWPSLQLSWKTAPGSGSGLKGKVTLAAGVGDDTFAGKWPGGPSLQPSKQRRSGLRSRKPGVIAGTKLERCCQRYVRAVKSPGLRENFGASNGLAVFPTVLHKK